MGPGSWGSLGDGQPAGLKDPREQEVLEARG